MSTGQQPHQPGQHGLGTSAGAAAPPPGSAAERTLLTPYILEPPEWRAPLLANKNPALYPDFFPGATALYPQLATQSAAHVPGVSRDSSATASGSHFTPVAGVTASKEDELNETVAKLGFVNKAVVQTENFSAHALIHNKLHNGPSIHALGKIIQRVLERQNADDTLLPNPGPWTYKAPSRVVYNASRLESWYADLANPSVPLSKLAKNIPSAPSSSAQNVISAGTGIYTGASSSAGPSASATKVSGSAMDRNLDMLVTRQVPLDRALWFLQAVGQNDIAQLSKSKSLQVHPILSYSADFTSAIVESLKRQIGEALLPITQSSGSSRLLPGMSVKGRPRNVLAEEQSKQRWTAKWNYTLTLLSASLDEQMLDRQHLASLLLQNLLPESPLHMLWWLSVILCTTIDDMLGSAWMSKALIVTVFEWLKHNEEGAPVDDETSSQCQEIGRSLIRHIWMTDPDMFLLPEIWKQNVDRSRLRAILGLEDSSSSVYDMAVWDDLEDRVDTLLCRKQPRSDPCAALLQGTSDSCSALATDSPSEHWSIDALDILHILDGWDAKEPLRLLTQRILRTSSTTTSTLETEISGANALPGLCILNSDALKLLLMWATTNTRSGKHRPYLAAAILRHYVGLPRRPFILPRPSGDITPDEPPDLDMDRFEAVQNDIMDWIDYQEKCLSKLGRHSTRIEWTSREATLNMCQVLLSQGILEISGLVQKVIARGHADVNSGSGEGIYSLILQEYGGHSDKLALRWQMTRVSIGGPGLAENDPVTSVEESCRHQLHAFLQCLEGSTTHDRSSNTSLQLQAIEAGFQALSPMKKSSLVNDWLAPTLYKALQNNPVRTLHMSIASALMRLLDNLGAYEVQDFFLNHILGAFIPSRDTLQALVSVHQVNVLVFATFDGLPAYASSLSKACDNLPNDQMPDTCVLLEMTQLGLHGHLPIDQLHHLRRTLRACQKQLPLAQLPISVLTPPEHDTIDDDIASHLLHCIQEYCKRQVHPSKGSNQVETTLINLFSICGAPANLPGTILPAMLQALSESDHDHRTVLALTALASAVVNVPVSLHSSRLPAQELWTAADSAITKRPFTTLHGDFLLQLVIENTISIECLLDEVCMPLLEGSAATLSVSQDMLPFLDFLSDLLVKSGDDLERYWRISAMRLSLYQPRAFGTVFRLSQKLSKLLGSVGSLPWRSQLLQVRDAILASHAFQKGFCSFLEGRSSPNGAPAQLGDSDTDIIWTALSKVIEPWLADFSGSDDQQNADSPHAEVAVLLLDSGAYSPFVSLVVRCYLQILLIQLGRREPGGQEKSSTSLRTFAGQCLNHLVSETGDKYKEQLQLFSQYLADDLLSVALETLSSDLTFCSLQINAASGFDGSGAVETRLRRVAQLTTVAAQIWSASNNVFDLPNRQGEHTLAITAVKDEDFIDLVSQAAGALVATLTVRARMHPTLRPYTKTRVALLSRVVCVVKVISGSGAQLSASYDSCIASLLEYLRGNRASGLSDRYLRDILDWLLHAVPAPRKQRILAPFQQPLLFKGAADDLHKEGYGKLVSLGPQPPHGCVAWGETRFIILQKTWTGLSVNAETKPSSDAIINNEPVDLLRYHCQSRSVDRQLQPAYRGEKLSSWKILDSDMPWHSGTTFQRDFRRSTITQPEFISNSQAQTIRHRAALQAENRLSQAATNLPTNIQPKQAIKERGAEAPTREAAGKKRKVVPDVIIVEDNPPKKKNRNASNVGHVAQSVKPSKRK